jgi:hypothetical protein
VVVEAQMPGAGGGDKAGGRGEQPQTEGLGFPAAARPVERKHGQPGQQVQGEGDNLQPHLVLTVLGFRHGASADDNAQARPVLRAVSSSRTPPACETTPVPPPDTRTRGYDPLRLLTLRAPFASATYRTLAVPYRPSAAACSVFLTARRTAPLVTARAGSLAVSRSRRGAGQTVSFVRPTPDAACTGFNDDHNRRRRWPVNGSRLPWCCRRPDRMTGHDHGSSLTVDRGGTSRDRGASIGASGTARQRHRRAR